MNEIRKFLMVFYVSIVFGFLLGFLAVWLLAPEVGGEWWPYLRLGFSSLGGIIVARVVQTVVPIILLNFVFQGIENKLFGTGSEDNPWTEEDVENLMDQFE